MYILADCCELVGTRTCIRVCIDLSFSLLTLLQVALAELREGGGQATTPATTTA